MLGASVARKFSGLLLGGMLWLSTFPWADYRCAAASIKLQKSIAIFEEGKGGQLPPFGLWEEQARKDFRLGVQLLGFYEHTGAYQRAADWARVLLPDLQSQPLAEQFEFWAHALELQLAPELQKRAVTTLRASDPQNPAWLFHHYILSQQLSDMPLLTAEEKSTLSQQLIDLGESAIAQEILVS